MEKQKQITTGSLTIDNNIIFSNSSLLQISSIANIDVEPKTKRKANPFGYLILVIGAWISYLALRWEIESMLIFGVILIVVALGYFVLIAIENEDNGERYLRIYLNSGFVYSIYCTDLSFLSEVTKVLKNCMNDHLGGQHINIDFDNCVINDSDINPRNVAGEDHSMNFSGTNTFQGSVIAGRDNHGDVTITDSFKSEVSGMQGEELQEILNSIMENLSGLNGRDRQNVMEAVDDVAEAFSGREVDSERLGRCKRVISRLIAAARGIPALAENLKKLKEFIMPYINGR